VQADMVCLRSGTCHRDRLVSPLSWRLGGFWLFDEELGPQTLRAMAQAGPAYDGNFQGSLAAYQPWCCSIAPRDLDALQRGQLFTTSSGAALLPEGLLDFRECATPLCPERALYLSVRPPSGSFELVGVADALRMLGGRAAAKMLTRETRVLDSDGSVATLPSWTPAGGGRGLVGGHVRLFKPSMVAVTLEQIGGVAVIFRMIACAASAEYLEAAVQLLVLVIKHSPRNVREMERVNGYAILGMLLEGKHALLNRDVLNLVISLTWLNTEAARTHVGAHVDGSRRSGRGDEGSDQPSITNAMAFRELLLNYDVWRASPEGLLRLIFAHVRRLAMPGPRQQLNITILNELYFLEECVLISVPCRAVPCHTVPCLKPAALVLNSCLCRILHVPSIAFCRGLHLARLVCFVVGGRVNALARALFLPTCMLERMRVHAWVGHPGTSRCSTRTARQRRWQWR
jgi:hypothetical protein